MRVAPGKITAVLLSAAVAGCQPPAAENYVERKPGGETRATGPSAPIDAPNVDGAVWAEAANLQRILYGKPGERPLFALECLAQGTESLLQFTRYARADEGAKAFIALIGNGHVARLEIDATEVGSASLWQGTTPIDNDRLEVLTGRNSVEATVPGAGSLRLNASNAPARLIEACRAQAGDKPVMAEPDLRENRG